MPRDLAQRLCDLCRESGVEELRAETVEGDSVEIVNVWAENGVICIQVGSEIPMKFP